MKVFPKNIILLIVGMMASAIVCAQPQSNYYQASALDGKCGQELELALKNIVYPHSSLDYGALWEAFQTTDPGPVDSIPSGYTGGKTDLVYDMYAWMCQFPKFYSDKNHTQTGGFNREHCVPNSWWGGESGNATAYTDLHHLLPSDGAANNAKGNFALGEYKSGFVLSWPTTTQTNTRGEEYVCKDEHNHVEGEPCLNNASHVWKNRNSTQYGGSSELFEPADIYKGDFARMYLYVVCAYEGELTWKTNYMFKSDDEKHTTILPWAKELLLKWHRQDPVSDKERARNNAIETLQHNRNPFIDYPELVEYIWGNKSTSSDFSLANAVSSYGADYNNGSGGSEDGKTPASIMIVLRAKMGKPFHGFIYSTTSNGEATYSSSNPAVASVDSQTGEVTINGTGEAIITYSVSETPRYKASSDKYGIVVEP